MATLDCVVVGVEVGHGKRHGVLSDYTFAVRDDRPEAPEGRLVTIGKAYSGLTDKEIAEMTEFFQEHTIQQLGRFHVVEPTVVVEIAFDVIQESNRHDSGYALRFPRIFRLRPDKDLREIDTLSNVDVLYRQARVGPAVQRPDRGWSGTAGMTDEDKVAELRDADPGHRRGDLSRHGLSRSACPPRRRGDARGRRMGAARRSCRARVETRTWPRSATRHER